MNREFLYVVFSYEAFLVHTMKTMEEKEEL